MKAGKNVFLVLIMGMLFYLCMFFGSGAFAAENQSNTYFDPSLIYGERLNSNKMIDIRSMKAFEILGGKASLDTLPVRSISETVYLTEEDNLFTSQSNAPQNLTAVGISTGYIYLSWNEVPNASYYNVYCYWDGAYHYYDNTTFPWFWDGGNEPNITWYYRVTAVVNGVESNLSNYAIGTTLRDGSGYLASPSNLSAQGLTKDEVFLTWDSVANASYYNIYWYSNGMCYFFAHTDKTSYFDSGNDPGSNCMYTISAVVNGAESGFSNIAETRTLYDGSGYINAPENFSALGVSAHDIYLSWDDVTAADFYNIYYNVDGEYIWYDITSNNFYMDEGNKPNTTWSYCVTAVIDEAESGFSSESAGTTLSDGSGIIQAPVNIAAEGISMDTIILTWDEVPEAEYYNIYCYYYNEGKYKIYATRYGCMYVDDGNRADQSFRYKVTAVVGNAESGLSNEVIGTTLKNGVGMIPVPSGLEANGSGNSVYLNWDEVSGAEYYNLYGYLEGIEGVYYWFDSTTSNYFWDDYVDLGVTYQYAVSAVKEGYESDFSSIASGSALGTYTLMDLSRLARLYGSSISDRNDVNGDGIIDIYDLVILAKKIG